jgi:TonB-linked SusC/RagA family outer membrane protein
MDLRALCVPSPHERRLLTKTFRIMKIISFLIFAACLQVSANGTAQTISLSQHNVSLKSIFKEIEKQTSFQFFYNDRLLEEAKNVSIDIKDATLSQALDACFKDQPISYAIVDKMVVVRRKEETAQSQANNNLHILTVGDIHGRITNTQGQALENANVVIKRTKKGTVTNSNGEFVLHTATASDEIIITFIGYKSKTIKVGGGKEFPVVLEAATNDLDKVVVQGYGHTSQRLATGNISSIRAEEIERHPVMNPIEALEGQVAGLVITQESGYVSGPMKIELRGQNSINGNITSDPLYVIDGVPLSISELGGGANPQNYGATTSPGFIQNGLLSGPANGQSPFFSINPADIESIEVLKDADATSIYGSRGANGVILITTKKGKPGKTKLDMSLYQGINVVTKYWDMLNVQQYLQVRREALHNDGLTPTSGNAPDLVLWDTTRNIDWQKFLWGHAGKNTSIQLSLSGGDQGTTFRIGAGYDRQTDITTYSGSNQRGSASVVLSHKTLNQKATIEFKSQYSFAETNIINLGASVSLPPDAPSAYNSLGKLNYAQYDSARFGFPFQNLLQPYIAKTSFLNSNLKFNYEILHGLVFSTSIGYNNALALQSQFQPIASLDTYTNPNATGSAQFGTNRNNTWIIEPQIQYNTFISKGKFSALLGGTAQSSATEGTYATGIGFTNDALIRSIGNSLLQTAGETYADYKYAAAFARFNYNWEDRYILNLTARRDGSSKFGPGKQYGNFGSIGGAWIFTDERWLKPLKNIFSFGKLRVSYGTTGAQGVGDYAFLSRWQTIGAPYNTTASSVPIQHVDSTFHWEINKKFEAALDLGFFKDRLTLEAAFYRNRCNNQLVSFPLAVFTGFSSVVANSPADVQNSGIELTLNGKIIDNKKFTWEINFNTGINRNKLLSYPNLSQSPYASAYQIGKPLSSLFLLHYTGIDPLTGQYQFQDRNKDGQISFDYVHPGVLDDRYAVALTPQYTGGLRNTFRYKMIEASVFLYFKHGLGQNFNTNLYTGISQNQPIEVLQNHWQKPGDQATSHGYTTNPGIDYYYFGHSDGVFTDASYIRVKNITLTYTLPQKVAKQAGMQSFNIFFRGENLFVFTKYKGLDPETQTFSAMPPNKVFTSGISMTF